MEQSDVPFADSVNFREALKRFVFLYRTNGLPRIEMIGRRRKCIGTFASLNFRRVYELRPEQIADILSECDMSYFADETGSYEDPAIQITADNPRGRLSSYLIHLVRSGFISRIDFEEPIKHMDSGIKTELAAMVNPQTYAALDMFSRKAMEHFGAEPFPDTYLGYLNFLESCKGIREILQREGILRADLSTVSEFLLFAYSEYCRK